MPMGLPRQRPARMPRKIGEAMSNVAREIATPALAKAKIGMMA